MKKKIKKLIKRILMLLFFALESLFVATGFIIAIITDGMKVGFRYYDQFTTWTLKD